MMCIKLISNNIGECHVGIFENDTIYLIDNYCAREKRNF